MKRRSPAMRAAPTVWLIGSAEHPDFHEVVTCVRDSSQLLFVSSVREAADRLRRSQSEVDLCLLLQPRPGCVAGHEVEQLRIAAPLTGVVSVLGSWCEGETRTGRPIAGLRRIFWYEFPLWWQRQLASWNACGCPDWALPATCEERGARSEEQVRHANRGLIMIETTCWETAQALGDVLHGVGFASAWLPPAARGAVAGIWEGCQLDGREAEQLAAFCRCLAYDAAPVVAILDFPRRDRCLKAIEAGAAVVIGKPWLNADLVSAVVEVIESRMRMAFFPAVDKAA